MRHRTLNRRRVLGGIGGLIVGIATAGTTSGMEHANDGSDTTFEGTLDEGTERESYAFEATAGEGIELALTIRELRPDRNVRMTLLDPTGNEAGELPTDNSNRGRT